MPAHTRIIAFASGKGGAGKTTMAVNIGLALASMGQRICLLDADLGLSNVDLVLGLEPPEHTLEEVLFLDSPLEDVIVQACPNLDIIPGGSGISRMAELPQEKRAALVGEFKKLTSYDFLLIDNSPGLSQQVVSLCLSARELVVVINPEVTSLVDAYALIKVLRENGLWSHPQIIVNRAENMGDAKKIFATLSSTVQRYLKLNSSFLGVIPLDPKARTSFCKTPFLLSYPHSPAARCTQLVAKRIFGQKPKDWKKGRPEEFWESTLTLIKQRPRFDLEVSSHHVDADLPSYAKIAPDELGSMLEQRSLEMEQFATQLARVTACSHLSGKARTIASLLEELSVHIGERVVPVTGQGGTRPQLLVVSNQVEMRQILTDMLDMLGYEAGSLSPTDGEFIDIVDSPCLGIVNADRPEERIRECLAGLPDLPLVMLGGYGSTSLVRSFADRIVAVIPPPVSLDGLRSTLENLVTGPAPSAQRIKENME